MEYRLLQHGKEKMSIIGLGAAYLGEQNEEEAIKIAQKALENGINYFDLAAGNGNIFKIYGKAFKNKRNLVHYQIHFGAYYTNNNQYGWTTNLNTIKESVKWMLQELDTDYIDVGFIHCLDQEDDLNSYIKSGALNYVLDLKEKGIIKHLGFSTHNPVMANKILDMHIIDVLMFSINPAYDFTKGEYAMGNNNERYNLYKRCEKEGVSITVMKPFSGGQLLDEKKSPLHIKLTQNQCIQYALDKPGVMTVLPGVSNMDELDTLLNFFKATNEEKDYSIIGSVTPKDTIGKCVYCKHCHPCPNGLDIALINKYYDLSLLGDSMADSHYKKLSKKASDCIKCGHCNKRCPFLVKQMERMEIIKKHFGE